MVLKIAICDDDKNESATLYSLLDTYQMMNNIVEDIQEEKILCTLIQNDLSEETISLKDVLYIETIDAKHEILKFHFDNRSITTKGILLCLSILFFILPCTLSFRF